MPKQEMPEQGKQFFSVTERTSIKCNSSQSIRLCKPISKTWYQSPLLLRPTSHLPLFPSMEAKNTTTAPTMAAPTTTFTSLPSHMNVQHSVSIKLTSSNYLLWLAQFSPFLYINDSYGHVDGTILCPAATLPNSTGTNPAYIKWKRQDRIVLSWLLSSLTESVLNHVVGLQTSAEVWSALAQQFSSKSKPHVRQLRHELRALKKGSQSMSQYLLAAKTIADKLAASGNTIPESDLQYHILHGLDDNYIAISTVLSTTQVDLPMDDFLSHLICFDMKLEAQNAVPPSPSAFLTRSSNTSFSLSSHSPTHSTSQPQGSTSKQQPINSIVQANIKNLLVIKSLVYSKKMQTKAMSLVGLFLFLTIVSVNSEDENILNNEVLALMDVRDSLVDPHGVLNNWDIYAVNPCTWRMVTCSRENLVTELGTLSENLSGILSPSIGNLTNLEALRIHNSQISGPIPQEIGKLSKLQLLDLSNNFFKGELPTSLGNLKSLKYIDLSYNNLSGPVPSFTATTFNIVGNHVVCARGLENECYGTRGMPFSSFNFNNSPSAQPFGKRLKMSIAFGSLGCLCILSILGFGILWWCRQRQRQNKDIFFDVNDHLYEEEVCLGNLKSFQFRELQIATDNFSSKNIIGKGGFGNVYRGSLQDGTLVAVKRLKDGNASGGEMQFQTEVKVISLAVHRNLIKLLGYCMTSSERLLVYPYMSNGSVASRLKEEPTLDWATRKRISLGAARGLLYLHEQCNPKIIHRDVKATNILLDDYCEAVVGDFGLAKLLDHQASHVTTAVRGTRGHIAPEYLSTGKSSEMTDVFGFGVFLLELITGQKVQEFGEASSHKGSMVDWVKQIHSKKKLDLLVDKDLKSNYDRTELEEMVQVAILCTLFLPCQRSKMSEVVRMLEGGLA